VGADSLVVLTDHPDSRVIRFTYDSTQPSLERAHVVSLGERGGVREAEFLQDVIVSTDGKTAVASVYTGKLRVITLDVDKNRMTDFDVTYAWFFPAPLSAG
jgi:DNA damage-binding protein 1